MIDALVTLGRVDVGAVGLQDFGRREGWLERQVRRWRDQLRSYGSVDGYVATGLPGHDEAASWLDEHCPEAWRPGIIHGDFSLANVLIDPVRDTVAAIVDWELCTIGDPLLDLGHLLATWPQPPGSEPFPWLDLPGLPDRAALLARYAERSDRSLDHIRWYRVLACYRLASILEGTYARSCAGLASPEVGERLHRIAVAMLDQAMTVIATG
jgi:aminoglycoside phosphotransferase (APT) family kinase protein